MGRYGRAARCLAGAISLLVLSACGGTGPAEPAEELQADILCEASGPSVRKQRTYTVDSRLLEDEVLAEDGTELLHYSYELPVLRTGVLGADASGADGDTEEETFAQAFSAWAEEDLAAFTAAAQEDYAFREGEGWKPYQAEFTYTAYVGANLVSIRALYWSYQGGKHGSPVLLTWNYTPETQTFLHPLELALDSQRFSAAVAEELIGQAEEQAREEHNAAASDCYWWDYEDILADWPDYAVSFDEAGMHVEFSPYELAAYTAGAQSFLIGYDFLAAYLSPEGQQLLGLE